MRDDANRASSLLEQLRGLCLAEQGLFVLQYLTSQSLPPLQYVLLWLLQEPRCPKQADVPALKRAYQPPRIELAQLLHLFGDFFERIVF